MTLKKDFSAWGGADASGTIDIVIDYDETRGSGGRSPLLSMRRWLSLTMLVSILAVCTTWDYAVYGWVQATRQALGWGSAAAFPRTQTFLWRSLLITVLGLWSFYLLSEFVFHHEHVLSGLLASLIQRWIHNRLLPKIPMQVRTERWWTVLLSGALGGWATEVLLSSSQSMVVRTSQGLLYGWLIALAVWLLWPLRDRWHDFWMSGQPSPTASFERPLPTPAPCERRRSRDWDKQLIRVRLLWLLTSLMTVTTMSIVLLSMMEPLLISTIQVNTMPDALDRDMARLLWIWCSIFAGLTGAVQTIVLQLSSGIKAIVTAVVCNSWGVVIFPVALILTMSFFSHLNPTSDADVIFVFLFLLPVALGMSGLFSTASQEFLRSSLLEQNFHLGVVLLVGLSFGLLSVFILLILGVLSSGGVWYCC
ncbi:MAG: hypothetical protein AAGG51_21695 [Cyanobacteria bacterium P01_G01_bin.54]